MLIIMITIIIIIISAGHCMGRPDENYISLTN